MNFSKKFVCECTDVNTCIKNIPAPLFRKSFMLEKVPDSAEILICGLGFYELFVNGQKITKGALAPYISNSDHYTYFDKYDLLPYLTDGENVIGVMLGDGHQMGKTDVWNFKDNIMNSAPLLALTAEIKCGEKLMVFEADDFVCKKGPIIFNDLRCGVHYDACLEEDGWNAPGFKEIGWHAPIFGANPRGKAKLCEAEPIKTYREIKPVSVRPGERAVYRCSAGHKQYIEGTKTFEEPAPMTGGYIYDFGENNSGIFRLKIKGERGQKVSLQCAEQLRGDKVDYSNIHFFHDGFSQRDIYILKGEGEEVFEPMFTYHGYRYVYVTGITEEQATPDLLTYLVQGSALPQIGTFECSDEVANKIYEMGRRSDISNFFYFPTDCPHREKNGWTGDASISAEHMIMTMSAENSWREWLFNIRAAMKEDGQLPGIIPTDSWGYDWGNGPAWDSVIFNLPYFAYRYRGDLRLAEENATAMMRYLDYISKKRDEKGLVAIGLGDWVPVGRKASDYDAALAFTDSVMILDMCRKAATMFGLLKLNIQKQFAEKLGEEMYNAIRAEFVDTATMVVKKRCQTSQAMAIFFDVLTEDEKPKAFDVLMDIIKDDNYSITSGFLGLRVLFHVLSEFGQADAAYKMITKKEYPSYGHWVEMGETTLLEQFMKYNDDGFYQASKNHHFLGDVVNWFMRSVAGLDIKLSGNVSVVPHFISSLDYAKASHKFKEGDIEVFWKRDGDRVKLTVKTTGDVKYTVCAADGYKIESQDGEETVFCKA